MPERHPVSARRLRFLTSPVAICAAIALAVGVAACTDDLENGGAACPALCPAQPNTFRDTLIDAVDLDTTIAGFPTLGLGSSIVLANRGDTVQSYAVLRFDLYPTTYLPNRSATDSLPITTVDSAFLRVIIDSTGARGAAQVELQAFDVDTTDSNPSTATLRSLFRADRLLGTTPITTVAARDTVRIPISKSWLEAKIAAKARIRIGVRLGGNSSAQVRIVQQSLGLASPEITFDPNTDTTYIPYGISPNTAIGGTTPEQLLAAAISPLTIIGTLDAGAQTLSVGGLPSRRSYLRFNIPQSILDSSTVVRAELLLTQRRNFGVDPTDTIGVVPLIGISSALVTDIRRAMELAAPGFFTTPSLDSLLIIPSDSGVKTLNVLGVFRNWASLPISVPRVLVLRSSNEGAQPAEARFFSMEAPASLRPRLRITYLPRVDRALP
ncbi:MAG: hypothetical protein ABI120_24590 [Gemmatimonadaceae bacterium]